jgi:acid stress-induced BolA-like protein IbaG/YrbA
MQNLSSGLNALFQGTEVVNHPFYSIGPKIMFGCVSEHFTNLRQVKRCKTFEWGLNAMFRGTEVVKHSFYSIGPKLMIKSVSEHFANLWHEKDAKLVFQPQCTILGYQNCEASTLLHWTQNDVWGCFRAFRSHSTGKRCKTCVSGLNTLLRGTEVVKHPFYSIGPKMMFRSVSENFANLRQVKQAKHVFRAWIHFLGVPKMW